MRFAFLALAALLLVVPAQARTLTVAAHDDGIQFWFEVEGLPGRNPTIPSDPGETLDIQLSNPGTSPHNIKITGIGGTPCCTGAGGTAEATLVLPSTAQAIRYFCEAHPNLGMEGILNVGTPAASTTPTAQSSTSGSAGASLPALLAVAGLAVALMLRRR
ncbi:MAG: hypothetical protein AABX89_01630 [Candidatus Thermoplasmatota archaeon]